MDDTVLNDRTKSVLNYASQLDDCLLNHTNLNDNLTICSDCKKNYEELNNFYDLHKIEKEFCMDIVDLVSLNFFMNLL